MAVEQSTGCNDKTKNGQPDAVLRAKRINYRVNGSTAVLTTPTSVFNTDNSHSAAAQVSVLNTEVALLTTGVALLTGMTYVGFVRAYEDKKR